MKKKPDSQDPASEPDRVSWFPYAVVLLSTLCVGILYAWVRLHAEVAPEAVAQEVNGVLPPPMQKHLASERMILASNKAAGTSAPRFEAVANDGQTYRLPDIVQDHPAVLIFIKDGCPCSQAADGYLRRIHAAGRGWVPFYGVIDGNAEVAERWADANHTVFPILADPERKIIQAYGAENSAYVAFVAPGGQIDKLWAGFSESMLKELAERMKPWVKPGLEPFDVADAPAELYAGCAY